MSHDTPPEQKTQAGTWQKVRHGVLMRDGRRCRYCDARDAKLIDRTGPGLSESSFVACCGGCFDAAKGMRGSFDEKRMMIRRHRHLDDPATSVLEWDDSHNQDAHLTRRQLRQRKKAESTRRSWERRQHRMRSM